MKSATEEPQSAERLTDHSMSRRRFIAKAIMGVAGVALLHSNKVGALADSVSEDLYYSTDHLWVKVTGATGVIGLTDYAQAALGDVLYVKRPKVGHTFKSNETRCAVETASDVFYTRMPVSGKTVAVNRDLEDHPEWINNDSYGRGWIISIRLSNLKELSKLMKADSYNRFVRSKQDALRRRQTTMTTSRSAL